MILNRWNKLQGSGDWYFLSKTTSIKRELSPSPAIQFVEKWWKGPHFSYLRVSQKQNPNFNLSFVYRKDQKQWVNSKKQKVTKEGNFIESYFVKEDLRPQWLDDVTEVKLDRTQGVTAYLISDGEKKVWLEQDEFLVRKVELKPEHFFTSLNFVQARGGLFVPKDRLFYSKTKNYQVHIKIDRVGAIQAPKKVRLTQHKWNLDNVDDNTDAIQYFYENIR